MGEEELERLTELRECRIQRVAALVRAFEHLQWLEDMRSFVINLNQYVLPPRATRMVVVWIDGSIDVAYQRMREIRDEEERAQYILGILHPTVPLPFTNKLPAPWKDVVS